MDNKHFEQGTFFIGCNYWASHAGMRMWSMWDEAIVEDDLRRLSEAKICTLRVFPLWSDFQPLRMHYNGGGIPREIRIREQPLSNTSEGQAGVDPVMIEHFKTFCNLAEKYDIHLVVGLLTGWMSGRLFVPELLQEHNVLTDPLAIKWEIKFVRYMVKRFSSHPAILAWDLGNECNCMGRLERDEQAYVWAATISMAIRVEDSNHPIVSGMHSLKPDSIWRMQDQGELLDVLTTHPYPLFTPHCDTDPLIYMKSALHATAESCFYGDIGGKQCFAEETGVLGPMMISDEHAAEYIRSAMLNLLAHDCRGLLWWCGFEQSALTLTPYDWNGVERELGLFYLDKSKKPVLNQMTRFSEFVERLPFDRLPERITDAVCILTRHQDNWAVAYGSFILAKQAGIDIRFAWIDGEIPEAKAYLLPDLEGDTPMSKHTMEMLTERVRNGAKLYMSIEGALLSPFASLSGLRVLYRAHRTQVNEILLDDASISVDSEYRLHLESIGAEVLAWTKDGEIAFARNSYGAGKVYTSLYPIEKEVGSKPAVVDLDAATPMYKIYQKMNLTSETRVASIDCPTVGLTEHIANEDTRYLVVINYEPFDQSVELSLKDGWKVCAHYACDDCLTKEGNKLTIDNNNGAVLILKK